MKSIQMMIFSYFVMRGLVDNKRIDNIVMLSARNKLNVYNGPIIECDIKDKYRRNKYLAIKYCKIMIENQDKTFIEHTITLKRKTI